MDLKYNKDSNNDAYLIKAVFYRRRHRRLPKYKSILYIVEDSAIEWLLQVHEIQSVLSLWGGLLLLLKRVFTLHGWLTSKLAPITHKAVRQADIIQ